jgi:hypothetical protein
VTYTTSLSLTQQRWLLWFGIEILSILDREDDAWTTLSQNGRQRAPGHLTRFQTAQSATLEFPEITDVFRQLFHYGYDGRETISSEKNIMTKNHNDSRQDNRSSRTGLGVALGAAFGFLVGLLLLDNVGLGIGLGVMIGIVIGAIVDVQEAGQKSG